MSKELIRVIEDLDEQIVRKASGITHVWEIHYGNFDSAGKVHQAKVRVLRTFISTYQTVYLEYSEDPISDSLNGSWVANAGRANTWLLPRDCEANELYEWLYLGNWLLYAGETSVLENGVQVERQSQVTFLERLLEQQQIQGAILAYHDNDPWWVALAIPSLSGD